MRKMLSYLAILIIGAFFFVIASGLTYGVPLAQDMDDYFIENGQAQIATNNIVTTIVFDYRGFDTLGESTVLFTAVIGVALAFRRLTKEDEHEDE